MLKIELFCPPQCLVISTLWFPQLSKQVSFLVHPNLLGPLHMCAVCINFEDRAIAASITLNDELLMNEWISYVGKELLGQLEMLFKDLVSVTPGVETPEGCQKICQVKIALREHQGWYTFYGALLNRERNILACFDRFWLFCSKFTHTFVNRAVASQNWQTSGMQMSTVWTGKLIIFSTTPLLTIWEHFWNWVSVQLDCNSELICCLKLTFL